MNNPLSFIKLLVRFIQLFFGGQFVRSIDIAQSYEDVSESYNRLFLKRMRKHNLMLFQALNMPKAPKVLDLGCGTGFAIRYFKKKDPKCQITGIDFSSKMLEKVEKLVTKQDLSNVRLIHGDILDKIQGLPANSYDIVICLWAFDYIYPRRLLKEVHRLLKKNGFVGIIVNSKKTLPEVRKIFWKALFKNPFKMRKIMVELPLPKTQEYLSRLLEITRFREIKIWQEEEKFLFRKGSEATHWIFNTGALAGYDHILDVKNDPELSQYFNENWEMDSSGNITLTHKFIKAVAKK